MMEEKKNYKPWEETGSVWKTEAAFWNFVKGTIRKGWSRHPLKIAYLNSKRFKAPLGRITKTNPTGLVWCIKCEICGETFRQTDCDVDHIHPSQQERWYDDIDAFVRRMFYITFDDIQVICGSGCHPIKTYMDANKITWEEAIKCKELIQITNLKAPEQKAWLSAKGIVPASNAEERKKQIREVLSEMV